MDRTHTPFPPSKKAAAPQNGTQLRSFHGISPKSRLARVLAVILALLVWQVAAMLLGNGILLASPLQAARRLMTLLTEPTFWQSLLFSTLRIMGGFLLGLATGVLLAGLAARFPWVETLLMPFVLCIKSVPVASFVILCLIWLSAVKLPIFISFLMVFPVIYTNVLNGIQATDPKMLEMAWAFRLSFGRKMKYIYLPAVKPFLLSACSIALGLAWKAGIAAEVIGIPDGSIGEKLYMAKIYFETAELFAWTAVIVLISRCLEKLFLRLLRFVIRKWEEA